MTTEEFVLPPGPAPVNHGRTRSAWVLTIAVIIGAAIAGVGAAIPHTALLVSGLAVLVLGLIVAGVLRLQGHGQPVEARSGDWYEG
ncbi:MAG: hypothetical protein L0G23_10485 [Ruaniaceae bacterium]|nr:hypothetical protein [Ruaniaceae bacterium]